MLTEGYRLEYSWVHIQQNSLGYGWVHAQQDTVLSSCRRQGGCGTGYWNKILVHISRTGHRYRSEVQNAGREYKMYRVQHSL